MNQIFGLLGRFFTDKNGNSRGWQAFCLVTLIGVAITISIAWKANGPNQPRLNASAYVIVPLVFAAVGGLLWAADVLRRRRFARLQATSGIPVQASIAQESARNKRAAGWIAAVIGVTVMPLVLWGFGGMIAKNYASLGWSETNCRVVRCEVDKPWKTYQFRISVAYTLNGTAFNSTVGAPTVVPVRSSAEAKRIEAQFQPGSQHRLYVNPGDPNEATLRRGSSIGAMIATVTMPIFTFICITASLRFMLRKGGRPRASARPVDANVDQMKLAA